MARTQERIDSTVLNSWTATLLAALDAHGVDAAALAAANGILPDMLDDPARRIPLSKSTQLWRAAVEMTGDDAFGIETSRHARPGSFHALGSAFLSSPTLRRALERTARFSRVTSDVAQAATRLEGHEFIFVVGWRPGADRPAFQAVDALLSTIVRSARLLLGDVSPSRLELERPEPIRKERFEHHFRCPISFGCPENILAFDRAVAERRIPGGDDHLASASEALLDSYLAGLDSASVSAQVRAVIIDALAMGEPEIAAVAAELAMSPRTLQRHLAEEDTTFRTVLAETRRELADQLLSAGASVTEAAHRLGFSEMAAFSRAYRRWTGSSPSRSTKKRGSSR